MVSADPIPVVMAAWAFVALAVIAFTIRNP